MDTFANNIQHLPLSFARNKLTVHIDAAEPTTLLRANMLTHIEVLIPKAYQSAEYLKIAERVGSERPAQLLSGATYYYGTDFDINSIIDGLLSFCPPKAHQTLIMSCASMTIPFKIRSYIEKNGQRIGTETLSAQQFAIKSKLAVDEFAGWKDVYFSKYYDENAPFLTFQPDHKTIDRQQPEFLYWLCNAFPKPTGITLRVKITFADATTQTITTNSLNTVAQYTVYSIPVGFLALGLDNYETSKPIVEYAVWLNNEAGNRITTIRTYHIDQHYEPNVRYLIMVNSLGGYDTIRTLGTAQGSLKVVRNKGEKQLESNYQPCNAETFVTGVTGTKEITINTGYFDAENAQYWSELMFAEEIYIDTKDGFVPLTLITDSYLYTEDNVDLVGKTFVFEYAKTELGFSDLPVAPLITTRELAWIPSAPYCIYNPETGLTTGYQAAAQLILTYKDTGEPVKGVPIKDNLPNTDGYFSPVLSDACGVGYAPFKNAQITRLGTFTKNDCVNSYGDYAMITVAANAFGGQTQTEANEKAESQWIFLNTQAYANLNGACLAAPEFYTINPQPPVNFFNYRYACVPSNITNYIHGGAGVNSSDPMSVVYGNHWAVQDNQNADSVVYPVGRNDIFLPTTANNYIITINGYSAPVRVKVYVNGGLLMTKTINPAEFQNGNGAYLYRLVNVSFPSQAKVYCLIETL